MSGRLELLSRITHGPPKEKKKEEQIEGRSDNVEITDNHHTYVREVWKRF